MKKSLYDHLFYFASNSPNSIFLEKPEFNTKYTYSQLLLTTKDFYTALKTHSQIKEGSKILYLAYNSWEIFPLILTSSLLGITLVPINPEMHANDIKYIIQDLNPNAIIGKRMNVEKLEIDIPKIKLEDLEEIKTNGTIKFTKIKRNYPLLIIYTSGSSGRNKGVKITENNILSSAQSIKEFYNITSNERLLCILPVYHMNAIMVTGIVPLISGSTIILSDVFNLSNAASFYEIIENRRPTILSLIPTIMSYMLKTFPKDFNGQSLGIKFGFCGAAPLNNELWKNFEKQLNIIIYQGYGLTETTFWATLTPTNNSKDYTSVGVPYDCIIEIDSQDSNVGEILIKGPCIMSGYHNLNEGFNEDGWLKTGDIGYIGSNGQLYIVGRLKDIIIRNGINIAPLSIDQVLIKHSEIEDVATLGISDELLGERVYSVCVLKQNSKLSARDVLTYCKTSLSKYKIPDRILFTKKLPRGVTGKIIKQELLKLIKYQNHSCQST